MPILPLILLLLLTEGTVYATPAASTDVFLSQCGFLVDPIVVPAPPPPNPPPVPPVSPPPLSPPPSPGPKNCSGANELNTKCSGIIPGFSLQPNLNLIGGDISKNDSGSAASTCANICVKLSGCIAFSHNIITGICYFKNASAVPSTDISYQSWNLCTSPAYGLVSNSRTNDQGNQRRRLLQAKQLPAPLYWSNSSTWPNGIIPGIGSAVGADANIPCGKNVILDVANVTLGLLRIQGLLSFLDSPTLPQIYVKANYVLVEGQLFIGTAAFPYRQKAIIELTPHPTRANFQYTFAPPAEPAYPRNLGHKVFAVVGGQVRLHGLPGPPSMPVWVRLSKDANDDDTTIQVDADVAGSWPIGGQIVVTSSDFDRFQSEKRTITNVTSTGNGQAIISLDPPLQYKHYGTINGLSDGFGGNYDERSEVMLLTRNIVITGTDEPAPYNLEGGHFMIFMTPYPPQYIEGVEFYKLGQQGTLGRYSLHLHILGSVPQTIVRKNAIHQSKQRCIVNHASHNITIESNVAFNTSGHCFMLEEGGEENNTWINNIGALTRAVTVRISTDETDDRASTFWITNLRNSFIGNVAAGSDSSGFWFELRGSVRGNSLTIPSINSTNPRITLLTLFLNNTAHSNGDTGVRTYPNGLGPRNKNWEYSGWNVLDGLKSYRNSNLGMFVHNTDSLLITNALFADNGWGLHFNRNNRINVTNSRFIGFSENLGNPTNCWDSGGWTNCRNANPRICTMPLKWAVPGRSTGFRPRVSPNFGIITDQGSFGDFWPYTFRNISFAKMDNVCSMYSGLVMIGTSEYWNPGHNVEALRFANDTQPIWSPPRIYQKDPWSLSDGGEQSLFYTMFDKDGTFGASRGYVVANTTAILPPGLTGCTPKPAWNAFVCQGVCYRAVQVIYNEPGFNPNPSNINNTRDMYSYIKVTRVSDGAQLILDGNLRELTPSLSRRNYMMTLLANQVYQLEIVAPTATPSFLPANLTIVYKDVGECGQGLTFRVLQVAKNPWILPSSNMFFPRLCPGVQTFPPEYPTAQYSILCVNNQTWMEIAMSVGLGMMPIKSNLPYNNVILYRGTSSDNGACPATTECSTIWSGTDWLYDDSGLEQRPIFYNPIISQPANWKNATAPIGYAPWWSPVKTQVAAPDRASRVTYYFRKAFSLNSSSCYNAINITIFVQDGDIVYLNNVEILRLNLMPGYVDNKTNAINGKPWSWESYALPLNSTTPYFLVDGSNTIAVETHVAYWSSNFAFDMRVSLTRSTSCTSPQSPKAEICDGLDNNLDGKIDNGLTGKPLTTPCSTPCGAGVMTCINGIYQDCTAVIPTDEICDGKDNNCDGMVDNGKDILNCGSGNVCYQGKCVSALNATTPVQVWPRSAQDWSYYDRTTSVEVTTPTWKTGNTTDRWYTGQAPLGLDYRATVPSWQVLNTEINAFTSSGKTLAAYFAKPFTLDASQLNQTFNIDFSVRRVDGVVVYLNGVEIWRDNMNPGDVTALNTSRYSVDGEVNEKRYYNSNNLTRGSAALLKVGTNYITAELHMSSIWKRVIAFDLDLYRNVIVSCPSSPCVRTVIQSILSTGSSWKYADGSLPVPSTNWTLTTYDDSTWKSGTAPIGFGNSVAISQVNNGSVNGSDTLRTLYFRKVINVTEAACYAKLNFTLYAKDGAAVYVNGAESARFNLGPDKLNSTVYASNSNWNWVSTPTLTGGWLKPGLNLIAVEVHRYQYTQNSIYFDIQISGLREGISCSPDPSSVVIPWLN